VVYNDKDPETGGDFQDRHKTLQMPVGLNDILSSDGSVLYLRSQKIKEDGTRIDIGPVSGNATEQGGAQKGEGRHLFAPMGFLDDSWFHRSYWVYGKNFSGGHSGYFQAGKYTPEGRILIHDKDNVYGYAREARYYRWTTTMEHQLFSAPKDAPLIKVEAEEKTGNKNVKASQPAQTPSVRFDAAKLPIQNTPLTVELWILPDGKDGLLAQHGGGRMGYALALKDGRPGFSVRTGPTEVVTVDAQRPLDEGWHHLAGVLAEGGVLRLFVDGQLASETKGKGLLPSQPALGLQLGAPAGSQVAAFGSVPYTGLIDQFAVFNRALSDGEIVEHANSAAAFKTAGGLLVATSFDNGNARDESGRGNHGVLNGVETGKGKVATALWFRKTAGEGGKSALAATGPRGAQKPDAAKGSFVEHRWEHPVPLFLRAMAMAQKTMFVSGPPDMIEEEYAFEKLSQKDEAIREQLKEQDEALDGKRGASLFPVSAESGKMGDELKLGSPPVWDGMAVAQGKLYVATVDGKVLCFGKAP
jgi:hypothetical protein